MERYIADEVWKKKMGLWWQEYEI